MNLGLLSAILPNRTLEQVIDLAAEVGYGCIEVACWPKEDGTERRYAGVTHIDVNTLDAARRDEIQAYCAKKNVSISAMSYYANMLDPDLEKRERNTRHLLKLIEAAAFMGVGTVCAFVGRIANKTTKDNLSAFQDVWPAIIAKAEQHDVRIAIENCPMLFTEDEWPGGTNLATTPAIFRTLFSIIPSPNFGINFDPSHFIWQQMDYIKPLHEFKDKIFHIHFKDIKLNKDKLDEIGIMGLPLDYMSPKIPGLGDVQWNRFVSALYDIGYKGAACVEIEDKAFESCEETIINAIGISYRFMNSFL